MDESMKSMQENVICSVGIGGKALFFDYMTKCVHNTDTSHVVFFCLVFFFFVFLCFSLSSI